MRETEKSKHSSYIDIDIDMNIDIDIDIDMNIDIMGQNSKISSYHKLCEETRSRESINASHEV